MVGEPGTCERNKEHSPEQEIKNSPNLVNKLSARYGLRG